MCKNCVTMPQDPFTYLLFSVSSAILPPLTTTTTTTSLLRVVVFTPLPPPLPPSRAVQTSDFLRPSVVPALIHCLLSLLFSIVPPSAPFSPRVITASPGLRYYSCLG